MKWFQCAGDVIHLLATSMLLLKILKTRSCAGISGKSQLLYAISFATRYLDLFTTFISLYNSVLKVIFIVFTALTSLLIFVIFRKTYDRTNDTFPIGFLLLPAAVLALCINYDFTVLEVLWTFSIYLESVAMLPQLRMIGGPSDVDTTIFCYLFALWSYRIFYIMNWIWRYNYEDHYDLISICSGVLQVMLYWKLFYVYYTKVLRGNKNKESALNQLRESVHQEFCATVESPGKAAKPLMEKPQNTFNRCDEESAYSMIYASNI